MRMRPLGKQISRSIIGADVSALCHLKINATPPVVETDAGAEITTATCQVTTNNLTLLVNGSAETVIGTYTGNSGADNVTVFGDTNCATIQELLDVLNGVAPGQSSVVRRWRAGLGDFRPQFVIGSGDGLATAAANCMLGPDADGLQCLADTSNLAAITMAMGLGTDRARRGGGQSFPDKFESDHSGTVGGVKSPVRSAGRMVEEHPNQPLTQVALTNILLNLSFNTTGVLTVYDNLGNTLYSWNVGTAAANVPGSGEYTADNPICMGPPGSPLFLEFVGTGAITAGVCTAVGYERIA